MSDEQDKLMGEFSQALKGAAPDAGAHDERLHDIGKRIAEIMIRNRSISGVVESVPLDLLREFLPAQSLHWLDLRQISKGMQWRLMEEFEPEAPRE